MKTRGSRLLVIVMTATMAAIPALAAFCTESEVALAAVVSTESRAVQVYEAEQTHVLESFVQEESEIADTEIQTENEPEIETEPESESAETEIISETETETAASGMDISECTITVQDAVYTGDYLTPAVHVQIGSTALLEGQDYDLSYEENVNAGTGVVIITGIGMYTGTARQTFTIRKADQKLTIDASSYKLTAGNTVTIIASGIGRLTYSSNNTGIAVVSSSGIVTGKGKGSAVITIQAAGDENHNAASGKVTVDVSLLSTPVLSKVENVNGGVKITWEKVTGAAKYRVYQKTGSGSWTKLGDTTALSFTDKTVKSGTSYTYTVRCLNSAATVFSSGFDAKGLTIKYYSAPKLSKVENIIGAVKISWENTPATKYRVFRKTGDGSWTKLADTTSKNYTDWTVAFGKSYTYTVRCVSSDGNTYLSSFDAKGLSITCPNAQVHSKGTCGKGLSWVLEWNGTLTISGTGTMSNFTMEERPWDVNNIIRIVIKPGVKSIGNCAFSATGNLENVYIPPSVTVIGNDAFSYCWELKSITLPDKLTKIGNAAFYWCPSLASIKIPNTVTSIGAEAFAYCENLKTAVLSSHLSSVGKSVFSECYALTNVTIPYGVTMLGDDMFGNAYKIKSITIPSSVTSIGRGAFGNCEGLTSIAIPTSVTTIKKAAFYGSGLKSVILPSGLKKIEDEVFIGCQNLTSVSIPASVTSIGKDVFEGCYQLKSIKIPASVTSIGISYDQEGDPCSTFSNDKSFIIYGYSGSSAESYAKKFGHVFKKLSIPMLLDPKLGKAENVNGGVKITWSKVSGAAKYRVFRKSGSSSWAKVGDTTSTSYTDKTVKSGTKYTYTVRCITSDGKNYTSNYDVIGKSVTYIAAPIISKLENVNNGVKITWGKVTGASKYRVYRKTDSSSWTKIGDTTGITYTDQTAKTGVKYTYTVRCISSDGKTFQSSYNSGKTIIH